MSPSMTRAGCSADRPDRHTDARHLVPAADRNRGSIHHLEVALLHFLIGDVAQQLRLRVHARVVVVYAVHVLGQQNRVRADFNRAQRRRRIGREERVAVPQAKITTRPFPDGARRDGRCTAPQKRVISTALITRLSMP